MASTRTHHYPRWFSRPCRTGSFSAIYPGLPSWATLRVFRSLLSPHRPRLSAARLTRLTKSQLGSGIIRLIDEICEVHRELTSEPAFSGTLGLCVGLHDHRFFGDCGWSTRRGCAWNGTHGRPHAYDRAQTCKSRRSTEGRRRRGRGKNGDGALPGLP